MKNRLVFCILTQILIFSSAPAAVIYVDSTATGDANGSSWNNAYTHLQPALDTASTGDQIWVAQGTYYPTYDYGLNKGSRGKHFRMINGVEIYGGFPNSGNPNFTDRNPKTYITILSGDLLGNDNPNIPVGNLKTDPSRADNCYHIFYHSGETNLDATAILDGFTITAGNANYRSFPHDEGGGMYNRYSSPNINNCIFTRNSAGSGGGMANILRSSPNVTNCSFIGNSGGGMTNSYSSSPTVSDCSFIGNSGSGMVNADISSPPIVTNCIFTGNKASSGGGMLNIGSSPIVSGCEFTDNHADYLGGGMDNTRGGVGFSPPSNPIVTGCSFTNNSAYYYGGGMSNTGNNPIVKGCKFTGNSVVEYGGAIFNGSSDPIISDCLFIDNSSGLYGGGMSNHDICSTKISNCTFTANSALYGNALSCDSYKQQLPSTVKITNSILWDGAGEIWNNDASTISVTYCDVRGGWPGTGNIDADPCFVSQGYRDSNSTPADTNDDFWVDGNYHLQSSSPCIDTGTPKPYLKAILQEAHNYHYPFELSKPNVELSSIYAYDGPWNPDPEFILGIDYVIEQVGDKTRLVFGPPTGPADIVYIDYLYDDPPAEEQTDLGGNPRIINGRIDMGAYEWNILPAYLSLKELKIQTNKGKKPKENNKIDLKGSFAPQIPLDFQIHGVNLNITDSAANQFSFFLPAGSFERQTKGKDKTPTNKFKFDSPKHSAPDIKAKFDLDKSTFDFKIKKVIGTEILIGPDITVTLAAGPGTGSQTVTVKTKRRHLEYKQHDKHLTDLFKTITKYWLIGNCTAPDHCDGADLNRDGQVNFLDLALLTPNP
jgi:hypothetical protein